MPKKQSPWSAEVSIEIPFHDVDLLAIAWHGHYAKYFEIARCKLFDQIDYNYAQMKESGFAWPVIDMHIRYIQPCTFRQHIIIEASISEYEYRLKVDYKVRDAQSGQRLTKGHTIQVAVDMAANEMCLGSPDILYHKLGLNPDA
jgi:acyl-CoA thioester hydrolase